MLEVVFSESAAGCLSMAMVKHKYLGGASAVIVGTSDGKTDMNADTCEIQKMIQEIEEKERQNWNNAVLLDSSKQDIMCFPLALSIGSIAEKTIGSEREKVLKMLMSTYTTMEKEEVSRILASARHSLEQLLNRAKNGESIRIWTSNMPDEACGYYWIMEQLQQIGFQNLDITCVRLPKFNISWNNVVEEYSGWGEVQPHQWGKLALKGEKLPVNYMYGLSNRWKRLRKENMPLRLVLNGQLVGAPETIYDSYILRELDSQDSEFMESHVICNVLGKYALGISDAWVAHRINNFIENGMFEVITQAEKDSPFYHRVLRKCK